MILQDKLEDTNGTIRSKRDEQYSGQKKKDKQ